MAKPGSSIRSAARATFSALDRLPIRWKLAGGSAILTLAILCAFAGIVGALITQSIRSDFNNETARVASDLAERVEVEIDPLFQRPTGISPRGVPATTEVVVRVLDSRGVVVDQAPEGAPGLGPYIEQRTIETRGYRIETRPISEETTGVRALLQVARPLDGVEATTARVQIFLVIGVLAGSVFALMAGLAIARRAMAPVAALTATTREIATTRDPTQRVPRPAAHDEVSELAGTLDEMLQALAASREETEAMLRRQREFVADASHELRTPLTSVLANLELLAETLDGDREDAARSALRSTRRMGLLVADLLLLARADVGRAAPRAPLDVGQVLIEAAAELEPVAGDHQLTLEPARGVVEGSHDELLRLSLNLMENALRHTPAGTHVRATVEAADGHVVLTVADDGPGIPAQVREKVFERFVRGEGDRGGSFGLGLSIVRAVAQAHGGEVDLTSPTEDDRGTRFTVTLPAHAETRALVGADA
ncbi:MAG: HAMP domain-containing histidine kinase [Actinomycetota bacterium]|nr:HAMP domain-containing histidine kinase [Actinomycetota bacterium]